MDNESAKDANEHSQIGNATTTNGVQHPSHIENRTNILMNNIKTDMGKK